MQDNGIRRYIKISSHQNLLKEELERTIALRNVPGSLQQCGIEISSQSRI
jgi:hypothetical protein